MISNFISTVDKNYTMKELDELFDDYAFPRGFCQAG